MPRRKTITSREVAERAGVSRATVSNVLNRSKYVSPELHERVQNAIRDLNYRPNGVARSLAAQRTWTVGVVVARIFSNIFPPLMSSIERVLGSYGYSPLLSDSRESSQVERENLRILGERRVDGLLWIPTGRENIDGAIELSRQGIPVVVVDRKLSDAPFDMVVSDNFAAGKSATEHLLSLGHRRISIVTFWQEHAPSRERVEGYRAALAAAQPDGSNGVVCEVRYPEYDDAVERLIDLVRSQRPDALLACSDTLALAALAAVRTLDLRVGTDISVLGFDHSRWSEFVDPPLTVMAQDTEAMGSLAAGLLAKRIASGGQATWPPELHELPVRLIERSSCGEARARAR